MSPLGPKPGSCPWQIHWGKCYLLPVHRVISYNLQTWESKLHAMICFHVCVSSWCAMAMLQSDSTSKCPPECLAHTQLIYNTYWMHKSLNKWMCPSVEEAFFELSTQREKRKFQSISKKREIMGLNILWWFFENAQNLAIDMPVFLDSSLYHVAITGGLVFYCTITHFHKCQGLQKHPFIISQFTQIRSPGTECHS